MKNAAMVLGIIGGVVGMVVGFFGYGFAEIGCWFSDATNGLTDEHLGTGENADRTRFVGLFGPILGIAGGAMSPGRPKMGAVLMLLSQSAMPDWIV